MKPGNGMQYFGIDGKYFFMLNFKTSSSPQWPGRAGKLLSDSNSKFGYTGRRC
jgi:hypothetical protein